MIAAIIPHAFIHIIELKLRLRWIILEKAIIFFKSYLLSGPRKEDRNNVLMIQRAT